MTVQSPLVPTGPDAALLVTTALFIAPDGADIAAIADDLAAAVSSAIADDLRTRPRPWRHGINTSSNGATATSELFRRGSDRWWRTRIRDRESHATLDLAHWDGQLLIQYALDIGGDLPPGRNAANALFWKLNSSALIVAARHELLKPSGQPFISIDQTPDTILTWMSHPLAEPILALNPLHTPAPTPAASDVIALITTGEESMPVAKALNAVEPDLFKAYAIEVGAAASLTRYTEPLPGPRCVLYLPGRGPKRITLDDIDESVLVFTKALYEATQWHRDHWRSPDETWTPVTTATAPSRPRKRTNPLDLALTALRKALPGHDDDADLVTHAAQALRARSDRISELEHTLASAEHDRDRYRAITEDLRSQLDDLRTATPPPAHEDTPLATVDLTEPDPAAGTIKPATVLQAVQIAQILCPHLTILDSALDSARESRYSRPDQVLADLVQMDDVAARWASGTLGGDLRGAYTSITAAFRSGISRTARTQYVTDYTRTLPDGRTILLEPHISRGIGPIATTMRIYFTPDEQTSTFIVGHVGRKLRDASNPR